jgi:tetratricopeptide (TPR) repeat protein
MMPYDQNEQFMGRQNLLQMLRTMLSETVEKQWNHRVALYGMGGIGKTQTAIAYVYANRKFYDQIFWISGATADSLLSGFMEIATGTQCCPVRPDSDPQTIAKLVLAWLREQSNWLVVIDNLDDLTVAKDYLPERGPDKHTLITTRNPNANGIPARGLEVPLPDLAESVEMLCLLSDMTVESNLAEAESLVKELGYLPLAIDQAASYVSAVTRSFSIFLALYHKRRADLHKWLPDGNRQYSYSIATTWSVSFDFIKKDQPQAAKLFQLLAFLNPDMVYIDFLVNAKTAFDSELQNAVTDSMRFATALLSLEKFSLVKWSRESNALSIHRVIQAVVKDQMAELYMVSCMTTVVEMFDTAFPKDYTNESRPVCRRYNSQVVLPLINIATHRTSRTAEVTLRIGEFLTSDGKYEDSAKLCTIAVEIFTEINGNKDRQALDATVSLGECLWRHGRLKEAAELLHSAISTGQRVFGEEDPTTLRAMRHLGMTYWYQGQREKAIEVQKDTLLLRKKVLGSEHPETLNTMDHLGLALNSLEQWAEAAAVQEETVALKTKVFGADHPSTLNAIINLAATYRDGGLKTMEEAAALQETTLEVVERVLGEESPSMPELMTDLGVTYRLLGRPGEAATMHERAAQIGKRILGDDHQHVLNTLHRLAQDYHDQGRIDEALRLCENVVSKMKDALGENHHKTRKAERSLEVIKRTASGMKSKFEIY